MTTELMSLEEIEKSLQLAAKTEASSEKSSFQTLSIKGSKFSLGDERLGAELDVVVVATAFENTHYDTDYDHDNPQPPGCFSIQVSDSDMVPHSSSPNMISSQCKGCPMNEWGSGKSRGKKCKNGRRLALMAYGENGLEKDQVVILRLPPKSLKHWSSYVKTVTNRTKKPTFAVVTTLTFDDKEDYPVVLPKFKSLIEDASELSEILSRREEFEILVTEPYDVSGYMVQACEEQSTNRSKMS